MTVRGTTDSGQHVTIEIPHRVRASWGQIVAIIAAIIAATWWTSGTLAGVREDGAEDTAAIRADMAVVRGEIQAVRVELAPIIARDSARLDALERERERR